MTDKRSKNEHIKDASNFLRGTLAKGLDDVITGTIADDDTQLIKFHGSYVQDDRDVRGERAKKKLEKAFSFMLRLRIPGGVITSAFSDAIVFSILIIVLLVKPTGILGKNTGEKV